jgi:hypothetical protein
MLINLLINLQKCDKIAPNKRVVGSVGGLCCLNPTDSEFGWFASWRDRSDPAAHGKHYYSYIKTIYHLSTIPHSQFH